MTFSQALAGGDILLTEGAVIERLRRTADPSQPELDPHVAHAGFIYEPAGAEALTAIYREYLAIAESSGFSMICFSPTWRANPDRLHAAGLAERDVNGDAVRFLRKIQKELATPAFVAGLLGCYGDAYRPEEALTEREATRFHRAQARALADAGADFLCAATLPAACEAHGIARALSCCGVPYVLSFIITAEGALLDGTPLTELTASIDATVSPRPAAYFVNCVHPLALETALARSQPERLVGFQANTSRRSPRELDGLPQLETEKPATFAAMMLRLRRTFGLRVLGGCCGTDARHIRALAEALMQS